MLRKNTTVKVLDVVVPIMAVVYFFATIVFMIINFRAIPGVFHEIFAQAFGLKPAIGGTLGAIISMGAQRGLFSNEAGSGSAPCAAAAADIDNPVKGGLLQAFGVFIDTIVICTCTAMLVLIANPANTGDPAAMLNEAMNFHLGYAGEVFMSVILFLFCLSTLLGVLFYARSNVAYLFGDNWTSQTIYKVFALVMVFAGGLAATADTWHLADIGIALMTVFNLMALFPMAKEPLHLLKNYKKSK